ncbi:MAG: hypothetical protein FJY54_08695 [Betaproteobacteria bacterium]|nr:hypothetical protein [Betaproteobacteria bacterium]
MSEQQQSRSEESLRHEYSEAVQTIRHYANLRFALFSIFFAVIGGTGIVASGKGQFDAQAALAARIAGFVVITIFWMYIEVLGRSFQRFMAMAVEIERAIGYTQWTRRPSFLLPGYVMFRLFFFLLTVLWVYAVYSVPLDR